jgi:hypothetical protein
LEAGFQMPSLGDVPGFRNPRDAKRERYLKRIISLELKIISKVYQRLTPP